MIGGLAKEAMIHGKEAIDAEVEKAQTKFLFVAQYCA